MYKNYFLFLVLSTLIYNISCVPDDSDSHQPCIFNGNEKCRETDAAHCKCPCLPKCCPPNHILSTKPKFHGLSCEPQKLTQLPQVPFLGHGDGVSQNNRFFHSVFPSCEGTSDNPTDRNKWSYTIHPRDTFVLDSNNSFQFILYTHKTILDAENETNNREMIFNNISSLG